MFEFMNCLCYAVFMIIGIINQKGGVGKTTLSVNVAAAFAEEPGARVLLVDTDYQATARQWAAKRKENKLPHKFVVAGIIKANIYDKYLATIREKYDYVVIDAPAGRGDDTRITRDIISVADLVLVPVRPNGPDVWASDRIINLINEVRAIKPEIKAAYIVNCRQDNTMLARETDAVLAKQPIPTLKTMIKNKTGIGWSFSRGLSVFDLKKERNKNAVGLSDFVALKNEIVEVMKK